MPKSKLNETEQEELRKLAGEGWTTKELGEKFEVSRYVIIWNLGRTKRKPGPNYCGPRTKRKPSQADFYKKKDNPSKYDYTRTGKPKDQTPRTARELLLKEKYGRFLSKKEIAQVSDYFKPIKGIDDMRHIKVAK